MVYPTLEIEKSLWVKGYKYVCGMDEVGRGCFAGPLVVGAVVFPQDVVLPQGIADSKLLSHKQRESLESGIKSQALAWTISQISVALIDKIGIGKAVQMAFRQALKKLQPQADYTLIDAFYINRFNRQKQRAVKGGDKVCASISAASIIAKVYRDELMEKLDEKYPGYNFKQNKGYGTLEHRQALAKYGLSKLHRQSFNLTKFLLPLHECPNFSLA